MTTGALHMNTNAASVTGETFTYPVSNKRDNERRRTCWCAAARLHFLPARFCDTAAMLASASEDICLAAFTMFS
jgi:hypothetical protein